MQTFITADLNTTTVTREPVLSYEGKQGKKHHTVPKKTYFKRRRMLLKDSALCSTGKNVLLLCLGD